MSQKPSVKSQSIQSVYARRETENLICNNKAFLIDKKLFQKDLNVENDFLWFVYVFRNSQTLYFFSSANLPPTK